MPLIIILAMPFILMVWTVRYFLSWNARQTEERLRHEVARAELDRRIARPFKEYVGQLQPRPARKISFRVFAGSPPTISNIRRFAALNIRASGGQFFVQNADGEIFGPADEATMRQWIHEGRIDASTLTSNDEHGPWLTAIHVRALRESFAGSDSGSNTRRRFDNIRLR